MKDLDFDELDKAVNSLMGSTATSTDEEASADPNTSTSAVTTATPAPTSNVEPAASETIPEASTSAPATPALKRPSGRFMDVVHPSSDMKLATKPSQSREGVAITPPVLTPEDVPEAEEATVSLEPTPATDPIESPTPTAEPNFAEPSDPVEKEATPAEPATSWPDPLDMAVGTQPTEQAKEEDASEPEAAPVVDSDEVTSLDGLVSTSSPEQPTTPFLPDAKVEKRPLGGNGDATSLPDLNALSLDNEEDQNIQDPIPAELGNDVLAIEAGEQTTEPGTPTATSSPQAEVAAAEPMKANDPAQPAAAAAVVGATSIAQQYKAKPGTGDHHHEALYDTAANDNTALQHPAKKKSGWLVIIWVLLLITLGVGVALALYFFKII